MNNNSRNKTKILITISMVLAILLCNFAFAQEANIAVEYVNEERNQSVIINTPVDLVINCFDLLDDKSPDMSSWTADDITGSYTDENGDTQTATYEAAFAGWQLVSINGMAVSGVYTYPDNDVVYFDDQPYVPYSGNITSLKFKALWGITVYLRDKYNFKDLRDVYGASVTDTEGDVLTAKIDWDKTVEYSSNYNSGATQDEPVSTISHAYSLFKNTNGGKIKIVNHYTWETGEAKYPYSPNYDNSANNDSTWYLGRDLNIPGTITISSKNLGFGNVGEGKTASVASDYVDGWIYFHNNKGCGLYGTASYKRQYFNIRFYTNTIWEDVHVMAFRDVYNPTQAYVTNLVYFYNLANKRLLLENTLKGYRRTTTAGKNGKDCTNWTLKTAYTMAAVSSGFSTSLYIYGSNSSVTANDNVYMNIRGGSYYYLWGISAGSNTKINNIHINVYDTSITSGGIRLFASGKTTANKATIRSYEFAGYVYSTASGSAVINDELIVSLKGNGTRTLTSVYAGGTYASASGGDIKKITGKQTYIIDGQKITNFYGGGSQVTTLNQGDIHFIMNSGSVTNFYGGGLGGYVGTEEDDTHITIDVNGGTIGSLYGGGSGGQVTLYNTSGYYNIGSSTYTIYNDRYVYSSSAKYYRSLYAEYTPTATRYDKAMVTIIDYSIKDGSTPLGTYTAVREYYMYPYLKNDNNLTRDYYCNYIYAISDAMVDADVTINLRGGTITKDVCGGGRNGAVKGNIEINVYNGANVTGNIYAGGQGLNETIEGSFISDNYKFQWTSSQADHVLNAEKLEAFADTPGSAFSGAPAAGKYPKFMLMEEIKAHYTHTDNKRYIYSNTIEKLGLIDGNTTINVYGSSLNDIFGGSNGVIASISGTSNINLVGGTVKNVFGGGNKGTVQNAILNLGAGNVTGNVYGGGNVADVLGNTTINLDGANLTTVFAGGNQGKILGNTVTNSQRSNVTNLYGGGFNGNVVGNTTATISSGVISNFFGGGDSGHVGGNTSTTVNGGTITTLYGGGNNGNVSGDSSVTVNQGTITTAFGGGNLGVVEGSTNVVVGNNTNPYVTISSLLYGGGRGPNAEFETVMGNANVLIEGLNTRVENYGSSSLGKVVGDVDVRFKDYWTGNATDKYKTMNGIDRATNVIFDNSYVLLANQGPNGELEGIKDITNLYVEDGSGLKVSATGNLLGDFHGGGYFFLDSEVCLTVNGNIYGETVLVLNPEMLEDYGIIKGTTANPYMRVKGEDHSFNNNALYSTDSRYEILKTLDASGDIIYYIERDVIINDKIENVVTNAVGEVYDTDVSTWDTEDIFVRDLGKFTANVDGTINFSIPRGSQVFSEVTRKISLVSRDSTVNWPLGTIVSLYDRNAGSIYSYRVQSDISELPLSVFTDISTGGRYIEVDDITSDPYRVAEGETSESYEFTENYRIIVDFSEVDAENTLPTGPYNFMMNYYDAGAIITLMDSKANNILKIEKTRKYTIETSVNQEYYENDSEVEVTASITAPDDVVDEEAYNNPLYVVMSLLNASGDFVRLDDDLMIYVGGNLINKTNSNATFLLLDTLPKNTFNASSTITIDMDGIKESNKLKSGFYVIRLEYYSGTSDGILLEKITSYDIPFEIKKFSSYSMVAELTGGTDILNVPQGSTRTVTVRYKGELIEPHVEIQVGRSVGNNTFIPATNEFLVTRINDLQATQDVTLTVPSAITVGEYKLEFILKDKVGREKAREALMFNVQ